MNTVCHKKKDMDAKWFITNNLSQESVNSLANNYGWKNDNTTIDSYIKY